MDDKDMNIVKRIALGALAAFVAVTLFLGGWFTVAQYEQGIVTTWGKISYIAGPGFSFKVPLVQSVKKIRTDILSIQPDKKVNTYTADNQEIDVLFTVFYRVPVANVGFVYENAQDYRERLFNIANDRLKAEMGKVKLEHFAENRGKVRDTVKVTMAQDAKVLGLEVTDFQLTDVDYTPAFRKAVEAASVQKAGVETKEWERQQAEKNALTAKINAEGQANAALVLAQAKAKAIKLEGEAQADAMRAQAEALARNPVLVEMKKAERWDGALPVQMLSGVTPFMQFNAPK